MGIEYVAGNISQHIQPFSSQKYPTTPLTPVFMPSSGSRLPTKQESWGSLSTPHFHPLLTWPISVLVSHNFKYIS